MRLNPRSAGGLRGSSRGAEMVPGSRSRHVFSAILSPLRCVGVRPHGAVSVNPSYPGVIGKTRPSRIVAEKMDVDNLLGAATDFFREHTLWAVLVLTAIGTFVYWKPKDSFRVVLAAMTLGAIIYVLSFLVDLTSRGIDGSRQFTTTPKVEVE